MAGYRLFLLFLSPGLFRTLAAVPSLDGLFTRKEPSTAFAAASLYQNNAVLHIALLYIPPLASSHAIVITVLVSRRRLIIAIIFVLSKPFGVSASIRLSAL